MSNFLDRIGSAPISWGICEAPGWGLQLPVERVLSEARQLGITDFEQGALGWLPTDPVQLRTLLDDHDLLPEADRALTAPLERAMGAVRWVAAGARPRGFSASPIAQRVRSARSVVHLRPHDPREAHELLGVVPPWHPGLPMVEGRGLVAVDRVATMIQFSDPYTPTGC